MKILQVCPYNFSRPGGVRTHILGLSEALRDKGHDAKIVVPKQSDTEDYGSDIYAFGRNMGLAFGGTKIDLNICIGKEYRELKKFLKEEKFDVVHYHTIWNPFLAFQVRMIFRGHQVATFHDTPSDSRIGRFLGRWVMPLMGKVIFNWLDQIISVSETQKKCISRFSNRDIRIVSNGIAPLKIGTTIAKYHDGKFNLLFLGRHEPRKGVMDAIKAFEIYSKNHTSSRLIVAGEGKETEMAMEYCVKNKLTQKIEFLGRVSGKERHNLLATVDVYLAPALYGESFGIVLLEAMQAGVPLVGYANDGYKELLTSEQLDYFVSPSNISDLAKVISKIQDENSLTKLRQIGHSHVEKYEWSQLVSPVEKLYANP